MKKVGDLMRELGFREDAPDSAKRAFIENLVRAAEKSRVSSSQQIFPIEEVKAPQQPQQLSFDLGDPQVLEYVPRRRKQG